jgi:hypothetical protein
VRGLFATGDRMGQLIGHDGKKRTVTFGDEGDGPTEGAYRTARLWSRLGMIWFGIPAAILTVISALLMVDFATDLATTWDQVATFSAIAIALSLCSTGLLAWAGLIEASHPVEAQRMQAAWAGLLGLAAVAMLFFVFRLDAPTSSPSASPDRATELRARLATLASPAEWDAWNASNGCASPSAQFRAACAGITTRRDREWAELRAIETGSWISGWSPGALIGTGHVAGISDVLRRLLVALLTLIAMAGAGVLARWGAMGHAEAFRQADGIVAAPRAPVTVGAGGPPALVSPLATTDLWFQGRVHQNAEGKLSPTEAYDDYVRTCAENSLPPIASGAFFNFLSAKAKASGGKVFRGKASSNFYHGWALGQSDKGLLPGNAGELLTLPYRS